MTPKQEAQRIYKQYFDTLFVVPIYAKTCALIDIQNSINHCSIDDYNFLINVKINLEKLEI